ncbi:MAG: transketolase [Rhodospirillaceae bacterium]|nr:transketolase [Rhodospirillales bacterium]
MDSTCRRMRAEILDISFSSGHGHIPTCFSVVECLYAAYEVMRHDPKRPDWAERDRFVLSKGHAALGYYAVLAQHSYFDIKEVAGFGAYNSRFGCHADRTKLPGVEASTGSLGHGIGIAVGMALGERVAGRQTKVFTLIGDGESNEGSVWEAVMVANNVGLNNLTIIYDHNKSQGRCLPVTNPGERFRSFGCEVVEVNGHNVDALKEVFARPATGVRAVIADTVKGYGCKTLVDNVNEWHRKSPDAEQLAKLLEELHAPAI